jgi:hypothetical protein
MDAFERLRARVEQDHLAMLAEIAAR